MERLTKLNNGVWDVPLRLCEDGAYIPSQQIIDRLAAYEDTGLEPEEIVGPYDNLKAHLYDVEHELKAYKQAEAEGRLLVLPCAVSDPVYVIEAEYQGRKKVRDYVEPAEIDCFRIGHSGVPLANICTDGGSWYEAMGPKDYYTSPEAAEKALAERKGQDNG